VYEQTEKSGDSRGQDQKDLEQKVGRLRLSLYDQFGKMVIHAGPP
jgi:hypothetical protein